MSNIKAPLTVIGLLVLCLIHAYTQSNRITDAEAVSMSRYLVEHDGLFLGSSSACNLVASVRLAKAIGRHSGRTIVTILCDSGSRHYSKVSELNYSMV